MSAPTAQGGLGEVRGRASGRRQAVVRHRRRRSGARPSVDRSTCPFRCDGTGQPPRACCRERRPLTVCLHPSWPTGRTTHRTIRVGGSIGSAVTKSLCFPRNGDRRAHRGGRRGCTATATLGSAGTTQARTPDRLFRGFARCPAEAERAMGLARECGQQCGGDDDAAGFVGCVLGICAECCAACPIPEPRVEPARGRAHRAGA